jgi:hypothetical protein
LIVGCSGKQDACISLSTILSLIMTAPGQLWGGSREPPVSFVMETFVKISPVSDGFCQGKM